MQPYNHRAAFGACACHPSRRAMLGGLVASAVAGAARGQTPPPGVGATEGRGWIDVHHHLTPPDYVARVAPRTSIAPPALNWSVARSLDEMDRSGVATSMLSISLPGFWFGDAAEAGQLARLSNEYAAQIVRDHPGRFGSFAGLPLPDIDASLAEIAYALDTLKADGVTLFTSYGNKWLGDSSFAPVLAELNRRRAVVYTHPPSPACCVNVVPGLADTMIEFGTDTTRTIGNLVFSGAALKYPDIRFIFSHAGGTMPFLIDRFEFSARAPEAKAAMPNGLVAMLRTFYYDTAQASNIEAMGALRQLVGSERIVFGTDYPYRTVVEHAERIQKCGFSEAELAAIGRTTSAGLLPRVAAG